MGVSTLTTYINERFDITKKSLSTLPEGETQWTLLFDGDSLMYELYRRFKIDWSSGGDYGRFHALCLRFFRRMVASSDFDIMFVFDGPRAIQPAEELKRRARNKIDQVSRAMRKAHEEFVLPVHTRSVLVDAAHEAGVQLEFALGRADTKIAQMASQEDAKCWVVSNDSDFMMYAIPGYIQLDALKIFSSIEPSDGDAFGKLDSGSFIDTAQLSEWLGFPVQLFPAFATLCGNDLVHRNTWRELHGFLRAQLESSGEEAGAEEGASEGAGSGKQGELEEPNSSDSASSTGAGGASSSSSSSGTYRKNAELVRGFVLQAWQEAQEAEARGEKYGAKVEGSGSSDEKGDEEQGTVEGAAGAGEAAEEEEPQDVYGRVEKVLIETALAKVDTKVVFSVTKRVDKSLKLYRSNGLEGKENELELAVDDETASRLHRLWEWYTAHGDNARVAVTMCEAGHHAHPIAMEPWFGYNLSACNVNKEWYMQLYAQLPLNNGRVTTLCPDYKKKRLIEDQVWDFRQVNLLDLDQPSWQHFLAQETGFHARWLNLAKSLKDRDDAAWVLDHPSVWVAAFILSQLYHGGSVHEQDVVFAVAGLSKTRNSNVEEEKEELKSQEDVEEDDYKIHLRMSAYLQSMWTVLEMLHAVYHIEGGANEDTDMASLPRFPSIAGAFEGRAWLTVRATENADKDDFDFDEEQTSLDEVQELLYGIIVSTEEVSFPTGDDDEDGSDASDNDGEDDDSDDDNGMWSSSNPYAALGL